MRMTCCSASLALLALTGLLSATAAKASPEAPARIATIQPEVEPEIERPVGAPQAVGVAHTLRSIPEACARLEGMFTGTADQPYRYEVVRISPQCRARAHFVDATKAKPSVASGWVLNDLIRVPSASCPSQQAVVRVWRKPAASAKPTPDGQGQTRIYLDEAKQAMADGTIAPVPLFAAVMTLEGDGCG